MSSRREISCVRARLWNSVDFTERARDSSLVSRGCVPILATVNKVLLHKDLGLTRDFWV